MKRKLKLFEERRIIKKPREEEEDIDITELIKSYKSYKILLTIGMKSVTPMQLLESRIKQQNLI